MSLIPDLDGGIKVVSMSDVVTHKLYEQFKDKILTVTSKDGTLKKEVTVVDIILFIMGLNIFKEYECEIIKHRSEITNGIFICERFIGYKLK